jgi:hypothetical protein
MKRLAIAAVLILMFSACEPRDRTPGMWLSGETAQTPVSDWSFVDDQPEVFVQTHPWYGIPFSVTVVVARAGGRVYVPSIYDKPAEFPGSKYWNSVIADNPEVVMKMGGKLYLRRARLVTDAAEFDQALEALANKYDFWRGVRKEPGKGPPFVLICMDDP